MQHNKFCGDGFKTIGCDNHTGNCGNAMMMIMARIMTTETIIVTITRIMTKKASMAMTVTMTTMK